MNKKLLIGCGLPVIVIICASVYGTSLLLKPKPKIERSEIVGRGDVEVKVVETGTIEPLRKVEVKSKVGGRISKMFKDAGEFVKQGDLLATIDPQEIDSQVKAIRAQLAGTQARMEGAKKAANFQASQTSGSIAQLKQALSASESRMRQAKSESQAQPELTKQTIAVAQAGLTSTVAQQKAMENNFDLMVSSTHPQAVVNAQSAYDTAQAQETNAAAIVRRQQKLFDDGFVSQQALDQAKTEYDVAKAHTREVKERLDKIGRTNSLEEANMKSQIASARSQVKQMEAGLKQAESSVAPSSRQREFDSAYASYKQVKSQLDTAYSGRMQDRQRLDDVHASEAEVNQIQNQLNVLMVQQNDTRLRASMSGLITKRYIEQGELVTSAIGSFSQGNAIFQLADLGTMLVKINVNEVDISKVQLKMMTEVTIDAARGVTFGGHIRKVSPSSQDSGTAASSATTQTVIRYPVEVQLDHADNRLKPGMSARCSIICARKTKVLRLPINCIQDVNGKTTVQIVTDIMKDRQKAEKTTPRDVTVGLRGDDFVEIISGITDGVKVRPNAYTGPERKTVNTRDGG